MSNERELNFAMSYDELINFSYEKETYFTRDLADLTPRGITAARIAGIDALRNTFLQVPTDDVMVGNSNIAKTNRDAATAPLVINIREVLGIAKTTFGDKSGEYKTFGSTDLSSLDAGGLVRLATTVAQQATTYLPKMTAHGLSQTLISTIETQAAAIPPLVRAFDKAVGERPLMTVQRHIAANALYDEISAMCGIAQVYYADRNPTKAADYIIYDLAGTVQQRNGDVAKNSTVTRSLTGLAATSKFGLRVNEGPSLVFYFSKTDGGVAGTKSITVANNPNNFTTHTAEELGYDTQSGFIVFCIHNPSVDEVGSYSVRVE